MSTESPPDLLDKSQAISSPSGSQAPFEPTPPPVWRSPLADGCLIIALLALTFLLGVFPLKDTDIYWHLRTGDLIRQTGRIPRIDLFTFTRADVPWIDLHWIFQIAISAIHEHWGIVGLNVAKCVVTCVAIFLLVTARRRDWPVWAMVLAWLPAIMVLGGRIYVRPETLSLLYLSIFLAILFRWDRHPRLTWILPLVQVAWVNSQGLFVLGPVLLVFALIDAVLRFGLFDAGRRRWWRTVISTSVMTFAACLVNPYFITGALYPLELAGTMSNPIFSRNIAELTTIPDFIRTAGFSNLPMQLHFLTMILGGLSFLIPLCWLITVRMTSHQPSAAGASGAARPEAPDRAKRGKRASSARTKKKVARGKQGEPAADVAPATWRLSPFRLLLYVAFSTLSLQATRNSHQFAAVVGTITAWNFGEWGASIRRRRRERAGVSTAAAVGTFGRLWALGAVAVAIFWVGSGLFYKMTGEGRVISLGEEPVFFAHAAARFAGEPGMPGRFLSFHNGHASLFEYYHGPERKVYTDPRLEVAGAQLFETYINLGKRLAKEEAGWEGQLDAMGRPVIMIDHEHNWEIGATLLRSAHWRCVWFDSIAAVFVHDSNASVVRAHTIDFGARHFRPEPPAEERTIAELTASAKAYRSYIPAVSPPGGELHNQFTWLGLDDARRIRERIPDSFDAWKLLGQIELFRELVPDNASPRFQAPFDPVLDLSLVRATYALERASRLDPGDFSTLLSLKMAYDARLMHESALSALDRVGALSAINRHQSAEQAKNQVARAEYLGRMGAVPATSWPNLSELDRIVSALFAAGRAAGAVNLLVQAYPPGKAGWEMSDRIALLWLHLGEPARARAGWQTAASNPRPALREARLATTYLVEGDFASARRHYQQALGTEPGLFEALYCLAVLEQDAGDAPAAAGYARKAVRAAADPSSRSAAREIATGVGRFARPLPAEPQSESHAPDRPH
jgi:tetratricopeptide (TPR) repeat protein